MTFLDGTTVLGTATLVSGQGSFTTSSLSAGTHTITDAAEFAQTNTCAGSIAAKGSYTASITFTPSQTGLQTATFEVSAGAATLDVSLSGTGQ